MIIYNYINSLPDKLFSHQHIYHQDHYLHYSLLPLAHESCTFPAEIIAKTSSLHSIVDNYAILVQFYNDIQKHIYQNGAKFAWTKLIHFCKHDYISLLIMLKCTHC